MLRGGLALLFGMAIMTQAQPMPEAGAQLAARISSLLPRRTTVSVEIQNRTALPPAESSSFRAALEEELRKTGLEMTAAQPETQLRVTISENVRGLLFVAAVNSGENHQVAMLPWNAPSATETRPRIRISMQPMLEQSEPIFDLLLLDSGSQLLVLGANKVSSYRLTNGKWTLAAVAGVSLSRPLPRDARGRIEKAPAGFRAYVPGTTCNGTLPPDFKTICAPGNEPWLVNPRQPGPAVHWQSDRNQLEAEGVKAPFYTTAAAWFAASGGRILDRAGDALAGADGWGSEFASIENPCGAGWMVLASKMGDSDERDQVQAYEIAEGQAAALSAQIPLLGPVTALWPAEIPAQATIVIRNPKTGNYEASRLGVACAE